MPNDVGMDLRMVQATTSRNNADDALDASGVLLWAQRCVDRLRQYREEINSLNVFPVPDADTGTNLLHTMKAAVDRAEQEAARSTATNRSAGAREIAVALGRGAVHGARGNSGVIVSQVLRAIGESATSAVWDAANLRRALRTAVALVDRSLSDPVEGTIVSVLQASATAAGQSPASTLPELARTCADAAAEALDKTATQLPILRKAGVVDAGGRGLLVLLDTLVEVLTDTVPQRRNYARAAESVDDDISVDHSQAQIGGRFEVMYSLTHASQDSADELRAALTGLGDSVIVVGDRADGDDAQWTAHVHCNDVGPAIEVALGLGKVSEIRVTDLHDVAAAHFSDQRSTVREAGGGSQRGPGADAMKRAVVAFIEPGPLAGLFAEAGAHPVDPEDGPEGAVAAVLQVAGAELVVLPNGELDKAQVTQLDAALRDSGRQVLIVPTSSPVQGLSALAVHDPSVGLSMDVFAMADAAAATRYARIVRAEHDALTVVGRCHAGDVLAIVGRDVALIASDPVSCVCDLIDYMLTTGGELVTLLLGDEFDDTQTGQVVERVYRTHPDIEVEHFPAGGTEVVAWIGVE